MSGLDELNRIIKNSKIIPENKKQAYEKKIEKKIENPFDEFFKFKNVTPKEK